MALGTPGPQPFFDHAHHIGCQQDRQDLPLVADLLDLEQAEDVEVRQALAIQPGHGLAVVPGVEQVRVHQHQPQDDAEDLAAAEALGCRPAHQGRQEHEGSVGHQVDQAPQPVQARVGLEQGLALDEHALGTQQVVHPHQQAGDDQGRQDRHEHIGEHPHQALHGVGLLRALVLHIGNGRGRKASLLTQRRIDLFHFAGADHDLEQAAGEERSLDQVDLVERGAVDLARVLQGQAQAGHAMGSLLEVVGATEAVQQLAGDR